MRTESEIRQALADWQKLSAQVSQQLAAYLALQQAQQASSAAYTAKRHDFEQRLTQAFQAGETGEFRERPDLQPLQQERDALESAERHRLQAEATEIERLRWVTLPEMGGTFEVTLAATLIDNRVITLAWVLQDD